jgi:hypothetical protein
MEKRRTDVTAQMFELQKLAFIDRTTANVRERSSTSPSKCFTNIYAAKFKKPPCMFTICSYVE